ncbi:hypothetical protein GCM10025881_05140 [Pseudolysinimonas kribbensis]|uniref:Uncharacterized protein n=1 Tax=Pseudolysinimonas kribbensis TaxID=433641 RepID=A0ABQ6JZE3_9MICO|nr:hypothetical protein [Pseudolysinimonas kribbensis]GMA93690.1 hypothetical protein GCM10025881_05140 [Pseudolysinimonas kribbensis]
MQPERALLAAPRLAFGDAGGIELVAHLACPRVQPIGIECFGLTEQHARGHGERCGIDADTGQTEPAPDRRRLLRGEPPRDDTLRHARHPGRGRHRHLPRRGVRELLCLDEQLPHLHRLPRIAQRASRGGADKLGGRAVPSGLGEPPQTQLGARTLGDLPRDERLLRLHDARLVGHDARELQQLVIARAPQPRRVGERSGEPRETRERLLEKVAQRWRVVRLGAAERLLE